MPKRPLQDEQFRQLVQEAPDIVAVLEPNSTVRYVCRSIEQALGRRPEDVVGTSIWEYLHPEESERVLEQLVKNPDDAKSIAAPVEFRMRHADGSWRHFEAIRVSLQDQGTRSIAAYIRDITERRAWEAELVHRAFHDPLTGSRIGTCS